MCQSCAVRTWFFFSSRRRHTRSLRDWSSDVCSSDLVSGEISALRKQIGVLRTQEKAYVQAIHNRSEERRVGKGVDLGGRRVIKKKKIQQRDMIIILSTEICAVQPLRL